MKQRITMRKLGVAALGAACMALAATPAAAAPGPTPSGYTGACNMLLGVGMLSTAMTQDAANGTAGMFTATNNSGNPPYRCPQS
jgi:hypothetical protein